MPKGRGFPPTPTPVKNSILLDVDGVLAPFHPPQRKDMGWNEPWDLLDSTYDMWFNQSMGTAIKALADEVGAQLVWCSSWLSEPDTLAVFAAYLSLSVVYPDKAPKIDIANRYASEGPTVWFDDDTWRTFQGCHIRPDRNIGLRMRHLNDARRYFSGEDGL